MAPKFDEVKRGISRKRGKNRNPKNLRWDYFDHLGKRIASKRVIDRCNKLVLPPAWKDVWISSDPNANLQATGLDAKGRLQYHYHDKWTRARAAEKFNGMKGFAKVLPLIRKNVARDLHAKGLPKAKVVALIVKLIDLYHFRVGNDEYAKQNHSYGLTTIKKGHITIDRSKSAEGELDAVFEFVGKSGKLWKRRIWEDDLANIIVASGSLGQKNKNQDLFRYLDDNGQDHDIKSNHINEYLDEITPSNRKVTAKDFRTWAATWKTAARLSRQFDPDSEAGRKRVLNGVIKSVAADLGNTVAVCRSSYIHPVIMADWADGDFRANWNRASKAKRISGLSKDEAATLAYLS